MNDINRDENDRDLVGKSLESVRVAIIADTSELAYTIPILLDGIGVLPGNITTLHDFESSNEVILCCVVLCCVVLCCGVVWCGVVWCVVLYCVVLYCIVLYCIVLYCIA